MKYIFDFGANKGQNLKYFLSKADRVCAVEAVPDFCGQISQEYIEEINCGRLILVNAFASKLTSNELIPFYQSIDRPGESTYLKNKANKTSVQIMVPQISAADIVKNLISDEDTVEYVKIDTEGADLLVLNSLIENNIIPKYLSIEIHTIDVFNKVLSLNIYKSYRIEKAAKINVYFLKIPIVRVLKYLISKFTRKNCSPITFSPISSGPYGDDLIGDWFNQIAIREYIKIKGLGAKDLHASIIAKKKTKFLYQPPTHFYLLKFLSFLRLVFVKFIKKVLPPTFYLYLRKYLYIYIIYYLPKRRYDRKVIKKFKNFKLNNNI